MTIVTEVEIDILLGPGVFLAAPHFLSHLMNHKYIDLSQS